MPDFCNPVTRSISGYNNDNNINNKAGTAEGRLGGREPSYAEAARFLGGGRRGLGRAGKGRIRLEFQPAPPSAGSDGGRRTEGQRGCFRAKARRICGVRVVRYQTRRA